MVVVVVAAVVVAAVAVVVQVCFHFSYEVGTIQIGIWKNKSRSSYKTSDSATAFFTKHNTTGIQAVLEINIRLCSQVGLVMRGISQYYH